MEILLLSTTSNVFSVILACAVWCADPKGVRIWRCATIAGTLKKFANGAEVGTGCRHATDPPTIHSNDNTSNDVVLHVLRMDSYKFPPVSYSVAVTRGGETKRVSCCVAKTVFMLCGQSVYGLSRHTSVMLCSQDAERFPPCISKVTICIGQARSLSLH